MSVSVKYMGVPGDYSGYGSANRAFITALTCAGVDVTVEKISQVGEQTYHGWTGELCKHLQDREIAYKVKILHITPDLYPKHKEAGKYHIGHLFWETSKLPKEWVEPCNQVQEIWTASDQQAEMIRKSGVTVPIYAFPQPIDVTSTGKTAPYKIANFSGTTFYSIFQWIERKNPKALLSTYWKTFTGKDDVVLVLKTYRVNYHDSEFQKIREDINTWKLDLGLNHYPKVLLVKKLMNNSELWRLHTTGDCFVTSHRGEGWQRPAAEAMLMGNPIISPDKTGIVDYLSTDLYYPCKTKETQVTEVSYIPWYQSSQKWLDVDVDDLSKQMLSVYTDKKQARNKGKQSQEFVRNNFNYIAVGSKMRERIEEIEKFV